MTGTTLTSTSEHVDGHIAIKISDTIHMRPCNVYWHVTAPYKSSFYYY